MYFRCYGVACEGVFKRQCNPSSQQLDFGVAVTNTPYCWFVWLEKFFVSGFSQQDRGDSYCCQLEGFECIGVVGNDGRAPRQLSSWCKETFTASQLDMIPQGPPGSRASNSFAIEPGLSNVIKSCGCCDLPFLTCKPDFGSHP